MIRYGIMTEEKNGKKGFLEYQSKALNIENIEKRKDFYRQHGTKVYLIKFEVISGSYNTLEKIEY